MLNKKEIAVMKVLYKMCRNGSDSCIVSAKRIIEATPEKYNFSQADIDLLVKQLEYDGYLECIKSDKKGEIVNVINLKQKGKAFHRELVQRRREIINTFFWRIVFAGLGAVVALLVNMLLNAARNI